MISSLRDFAKDKAWNWVRAEGKVRDFMRMEDRGGGIFECVCLKGWPALVSGLPFGQPLSRLESPRTFSQSATAPTVRLRQRTYSSGIRVNLTGTNTPVASMTL
jgi:hypothetical protein